MRFKKDIKLKIKNFWQTISANKNHKTLKRSYREDYVRKKELKGVLEQFFLTIKIIFKNKKTLLALLITVAVLHIVLSGLMSEELYKQFQEAFDNTNKNITGGRFGNFAKASLVLVSTMVTGGFNQSPSESQQIFGVFIFLITWLAVIYTIRAYYEKKKVRLRDALYRSMTPLLSTLAVLVIIFIQAIPIFIVMITYSAAVLSNFLDTPFYALIYFIFASLMILLSLYLLTGSIVGLVAVTVPGVYPLEGLRASNDLILGYRLNMATRIVFSVLILGVFWLMLGIPVVLFDFWLKTNFAVLEWLPIVPFWLMILTCSSFIFLSVYFYVIYKNILEINKENTDE